MKVYQLVAAGHLELTEEHHIIRSRKVYMTEELAEMAIPKFKKIVTTPKDEMDLMCLKKSPLRVFVDNLEVIEKMEA